MISLLSGMVRDYYLVWSIINVNQLLKVPLFRAGVQSVSLLNLIQLLGLSLAIILLIKILKFLLRERLLLSFRLSAGNREALSTLVSYSLGILSFIIILELNGFDLTSLAVIAGALGIGIGFGVQDFIKNFIGGLTLLVEGKLRVGDYIEFSNLCGYIQEISIRSTQIKTFDGADVIVPNSALVANYVTNWSYKNFVGKIILDLEIPNGSDPLKVIEVLLDCAYMEAAVLHDPVPQVIFKGFNQETFDFELWVWVNKIDEGNIVKSSLNFLIEYNLRKAGILLPESSNTEEQKTSSIKELLLNIPYFSDFNDIYLRKLIELGYRKVLPKEAIIFHEGEQGHSFYIVLSGSVEAVVLKLQRQIRTMQIGDLFGEVSFMCGTPYTTTTRTLESTVLFVIDHKNFENFIHINPSFTEKITQKVAEDRLVILEIKKQLQELGLLNSEASDQDIIYWLRARFKRIFHL